MQRLPLEESIVRTCPCGGICISCLFEDRPFISKTPYGPAFGASSQGKFISAVNFRGRADAIDNQPTDPGADAPAGVAGTPDLVPVH